MMAYLEFLRQHVNAQHFTYTHGNVWALAMLSTTRKCMTNILGLGDYQCNPYHLCSPSPSGMCFSTNEAAGKLEIENEEMQRRAKDRCVLFQPSDHPNTDL
jgi:hypothetical protein